MSLGVLAIVLSPFIIALQSVLLWLAGEVARARKGTSARVVAVVTALFVAGAGALYATTAPFIAAPAILLLAGYLALAFLLIRWALRARATKTGFVLLLWLTMQVVVASFAAIFGHVVLFTSFSIPTGNMAPTLLGYHLSSPCTSCGFPIDVGVPSDPAGDPVLPGAGGTIDIPCPQCGTGSSLGTNDLVSGDRVSIDKTAGPGRWDPIAFVTPWDGRTIYLHRLVGLPGETIEIAGGDVFADGRRLVKEPGTRDDMWILVHDSGYQPADEATATEAWTARPGSSWERTSGGWRLLSGGNDEQALDFARHLTGDLVYNALPRSRGSGRGAEDINDVRVTCRIPRFEGEGYFGFEWQRGDRTVRATLSPGGALRLETAGESTEVPLPERPPAEVSFGVRDGRAFILLDGEPTASLPVHAEDHRAFTSWLSSRPGPCRVSLVGSGSDVLLSRIVVERDIHYEAPEWSEACHGCPGRPIGLRSDEHYVLGDNVRSSFDSRYWTRIDPALADRYQPGTVPRENILGPLRMIFWPPERWRFFPPDG